MEIFEALEPILQINTASKQYYMTFIACQKFCTNLNVALFLNIMLVFDGLRLHSLNLCFYRKFTVTYFRKTQNIIN